jgi:uncharacterized damage-inducible protein DinB
VSAAPSMEEPLLETWRIHNRIHHYLLDAIAPEALGDVSASRGRTVADQIAHIHNVRLLWLGSAAPELTEGLSKIEKGQAGDKEHLAAALGASANAIEVLLKKSLASGGRIKGFKPHAVAFLGYLISHESHHRGQIVLTLKQAGHPVDRKTAFGLWEWGVR